MSTSVDFNPQVSVLKVRTFSEITEADTWVL
jgi:hypothetical protein